jgi:hypothetical protein
VPSGAATDPDNLVFSEEDAIAAWPNIQVWLRCFRDHKTLGVRAMNESHTTGSEAAGSEPADDLTFVDNDGPEAGDGDGEQTATSPPPIQRTSSKKARTASTQAAAVQAMGSVMSSESARNREHEVALQQEQNRVAEERDKRLMSFQANLFMGMQQQQVQMQMMFMSFMQGLRGGVMPQGKWC